MRLPYFFLIACILCLSNVSAQNTISFSYNEGGAMVERSVQVVSLQGGRLMRQVPDTLHSQNLKVYPNPASTFLTIEGEMPSDSKEGKINLINANGQLLKTDVYYGNQKNIPVSNLANGIYFLEIRFTEEDKNTYKIIIAN